MLIRKIVFQQLSVKSKWKAETDMIYENMMKSAEERMKIR